MKKYLVTFYKKGFPVCNCWKEAEDADWAEIAATWALKAKYPNVEFDEIRVDPVPVFE
jgi:hypothetical protein